jgi:antirestriction protein ArdC
MMLKQTGEYLTYKQATEAGGSVRKGEKSEIVVFFKPYPVKDTDASGQEITKVIPLLRYHNVFHISQCDGIEPKYKPEEIKEFDPIVEAESLKDEYIAREGIAYTETTGNRAFYSPSKDAVQLPDRGQFEDVSEFYSTMFHELIHSTGHEKRLNRITKDSHFGNQEYSKEELVAEIGAAAILNKLTIETPRSIKNNTAYVGSWLKALQNDSKMIVYAAGKAVYAVKLIYGIAPEKTEAEAA